MLVTYDRANHRVTITGHANAGEKGKDLVCSAASILAWTLASNVANLHDSDPKSFRRVTIKMDEGDTVVEISPVHDAAVVATLVFDTVCAGFELLAKQYPENIEYQRR